MLGLNISNLIVNLLLLIVFIFRITDFDELSKKLDLKDTIKKLEIEITDLICERDSLEYKVKLLKESYYSALEEFNILSSKVDSLKSRKKVGKKK